MLFAECTNADAGYDAERLVDEFPGIIEVEGALLDDLPDRLERFHYDLVATTTFHADEAQALAAGRVPVVAMLVGPGYVELVHEIAGLPDGSRVGLVCASERGADNILETLALSGTRGVEIVSALIGDPEDLERVERTADLILMSREALAAGLDRTFSRPERIRPWTYDFDPSGLELLRRAIEHVAAPSRARPRRRRPDGRRRGRRDPVARRSAVRCFADARLPRPARAARAVRHRRPTDRDPTAIWSSPTWPGIRRLASRMNARGRRTRRRSRPARSARWVSSTRSATCSIARYEADRRPGAMAAALAGLDERTRTRRRPPARPLRRGVPGSRAGARAAAASARGAAADPGRQREPGARAAARSWSTTAPLARRAPAIARRSQRLEAAFADGPPVDGRTAAR